MSGVGPTVLERVGTGIAVGVLVRLGMSVGVGVEVAVRAPVGVALGTLGVVLMKYTTLLKVPIKMSKSKEWSICEIGLYILMIVAGQS